MRRRCLEGRKLQQHRSAHLVRRAVDLGGITSASHSTHRAAAQEFKHPEAIYMKLTGDAVVSHAIRGLVQ